MRGYGTFRANPFRVSSLSLPHPFGGHIPLIPTYKTRVVPTQKENHFLEVHSLELIQIGCDC